MSRETDSSSSGPQGRGGAAYPSGTPPYGSRQYPSLHPSQDAPEESPEPADPPQSDEPRTETTLTTRIRINIPGSRPIPPVVMRTPMSDVDGSGGERTGSTPRPGASASNGAQAAPAVPGPESRDTAVAAESAAEKPAREKSGSDWFAPRKSPAAGPAGASAPSGTPPNDGTDGAGFRAGGPEGPGGTDGAGFRAGGPEGPGGTDGAGFAAGGSGSRPDGPGSGPSSPPPGGPRADLPYFSDGPQRAGDPGAPGSDAFGGDGAGGPRSTPNLGVRTPGPSGPTTGPATGTSALTPDLDGRAPFGPGPGGPAGPGGAQGPGTPGGVPPRMSDDTAVLTPQFGPGPTGPGGNVSGDTLNSGIPVVPSEPRAGGPSPFPGADSTPRMPDGPMGTGPAGPGGFADQAPKPAARTAPEPAAPSSPAKKGRSKLVMLCVAAVCVLGVAYGAGLLMNHSDVPKGTTVLGVDIGGGTRDDAVEKLDAALGERSKAPLQLTVDGKKTQLTPDKAGLSLDSQATVRAAAGSDYNPVSVIGSLFGGERTVDPVIPVDEEKLGVALKDLAGASGSAGDGTIKFVPGKAVAVPGKPGKALDVNQSMVSVRDAYRAQVETGKANVVQLPVTASEPTISQAELDRAMKEFAEPAMSGLIVIKAGSKQIPFGPAKSLPKILSMVAVDGKLVDHYDKKAIEELCGGVFDGIMVTKGDGTKHQVGPDDVAFAMRGALLGKTEAERTVTIDLGGNG
ncbi:hypothetical protein [Streptomyces poriferorum]|uniref:hypothetical protein n=1 Tax=Streptomyces poriferorum TaxID=2798799 RepID=UPI001C5D814B|nr:hypothetical protein [Streptomyces poriferorum]